MTARKTIVASITDEAGELINTRVKYAWNSAIRETEAMLRQYGRENGTPLTGAKPEVVRDATGREYRRQWSASDGRIFRALVREDA